jgi:hypothetical protein
LDTFAASTAIFFGMGVAINLVIDTADVASPGVVPIPAEDLLRKIGTQGLDGNLFPVLLIVAAIVLGCIVFSPLLQGEPQDVKSMPKAAVVATYVSAAWVSAAGGLITAGWTTVVDVNVA